MVYKDARDWVIESRVLLSPYRRSLRRIGHIKLHQTTIASRREKGDFWGGGGGGGRGEKEEERQKRGQSVNSDYADANILETSL